jgi:hypothetical protein
LADSAFGHVAGMDESPDRLDDDTTRDAPDDDTSGGPLSSGAGEGSGQDAEGAPDVDVPGGADEGV